MLCSIESPCITSTALYGAGERENELLFIQPMSSRSLAIYMLDSAMLERLFVDMETEKTSLRLLCNERGDILWSGSAPDEQTLSQFRLFMESGLASTEDGNCILARSDIGYGITLIEITPLSDQFANVHALMRVQIILCIALAALGIAVMIFSHRHSFAPVQNMLQNFQESEYFQGQESRDVELLQEIHTQYSKLLSESKQTTALLSSEQLRNLLVLRILCGRYADAGELENICHWLNISFSYSYFFACIFLFDHVLDRQEYSNFRRLLKSTQKTSCAYYFCLSPDEKTVVGIVNVAAEDFDQAVWGKQMIALCSDQYDVTLGIGRVYNTVTSLGKSYIEAHAAIDYRLIKGNNTWICYNSAFENGSSADSYPQQIIAKYLEALRAWDIVLIDSSLSQLVEYVCSHSLSLQQVKCICFDITSAFLRQAHALGSLSNSFYSMMDVFSIAEYSSIAELVRKIQKYALAIRQHITEHNNSADAKLLQQVYDCLRQNVSNSQFSLSSLAEYTGLSVQTIRRKFKDATGQTLNAYFTLLRIEQAKLLLETTEQPLQTVCDECGYVDVSSFIRLFKSEVGMSPGKFREDSRKKAEAVHD